MNGRSPSLFDRFAESANAFVSHAPFFAACVLLVVLWLPSYPLWGDGDTWQLVINTTTTVVTFLLVALLQNSQRRADRAINKKLDALADALASFMRAHGGMDREVEELREAVGLEDRVAS